MSHEADTAQDEAGPAAPRKRWLRRSIIITLSLPVLFFLLSNAWLMSPWGGSWIAGKITKRINLDASVGSAYWIPGGAVVVKDVRILQPPELRATLQAPVAQIRQITVRPSWSELLRGRRDILSCEIAQPDVVVSIEMLHHLIASGMPAPVAAQPAPPTVATQQPAPQPKPDATPATEPKPPMPTTAPAAPAVATPEKPSSWLRVDHARFRIVRAADSQNLLDVQVASLELPFDGKEASGSIVLSSMDLASQRVMENHTIPLEWKPPVWQTPQTKVTVAGLTFESQVQFAKLPGLPYNVVTAQAPAPWKWQQQGISAHSVQSAHRAAGLLLAPSTWNGESLTELKDLSISRPGLNTAFPHVHSRVVLQHGSLRCTDARAIRDDLALLGNATIHPNGQLAAVLRVIASPGTASGIENRLAPLSPGAKPQLPPFVNEDRRGLDILLGGSLTQTWISLDQGKTLLDARQLFTLLRTPPETP